MRVRRDYDAAGTRQETRRPAAVPAIFKPAVSPVCTNPNRRTPHHSWSWSGVCIAQMPFLSATSEFGNVRKRHRLAPPWNFTYAIRGVT